MLLTILNNILKFPQVSYSPSYGKMGAHESGEVRLTSPRGEGGI